MGWLVSDFIRLCTLIAATMHVLVHITVSVCCILLCAILFIDIMPLSIVIVKLML